VHDLSREHGIARWVESATRFIGDTMHVETATSRRACRVIGSKPGFVLVLVPNC
jgi:hypothetical protein